jgi:hypothetical protein
MRNYFAYLESPLCKNGQERFSRENQPPDDRYT